MLDPELGSLIVDQYVGDTDEHGWWGKQWEELLELPCSNLTAAPDTLVRDVREDVNHIDRSHLIKPADSFHAVDTV